MAPRPLVAGNWKMNGLAASKAELAKIIAGAGGLAQCRPDGLPAGDADRRFAAAARGSAARRSARQDCHAEASGAHTGDIAAEMLADAGARAVIVGHSERRADHHESDALVRAKAHGRLAGGADRHRLRRRAAAPSARPAARSTWSARQLDGSLPDGSDRRQSGGRLRAGLGDRHRPDADPGRCRRGARLHPRAAERAFRRSRRPASASSTAARSSRPMPRSCWRVAEVDGALVGGASLKAADFLAIAAVYR